MGSMDKCWDTTSHHFEFVQIWSSAGLKQPNLGSESVKSNCWVKNVEENWVGLVHIRPQIWMKWPKMIEWVETELYLRSNCPFISFLYPCFCGILRWASVLKRQSELWEASQKPAPPNKHVCNHRCFSRSNCSKRWPFKEQYEPCVHAKSPAWNPDVTWLTNRMD